jgi:hypothetical protein
MSEPARKDDGQVSPFERFKRFTRATVAVSNAEIEKKEAEYERQRFKKSSRMPKG